MGKLSEMRLGFREKLVIWIFAVTVIAIAVNYIVLVPRLDSSLKDDRVREIESSTLKWVPQLQSIGGGLQPGGYPQQTNDFFGSLTSSLANDTGYRVRMIELDPARTEAPFVIREFENGNLTERKAKIEDQVTLNAIRTKRPASGVNQGGDRSVAETAIPFVNSATSETSGLIVFSDSLTNVEAIVDRVSGRIVVAGLISLIVALMVGLLAARTLSIRVRRLQRAALEIAKGNFTQPLPVDSSDELGELAQAFNTMQERLGRSDRARKAFIATASHELRTPLFSLGGYMELLRDEELDPETQREFLETMDRQIHRLQKLATDLLDLSRIDAGTLDIHPEYVQLCDLARTVAREFEPRALQHGSDITVHAPIPVAAECDPERVAQVMRILVDNVLSHTPSGTGINLSVTSTGNTAMLQVADDGPGIPEEMMPRLFERFQTGDRSGGTGLGLSIAREIATAMGSTLEVESEPGRTAFTLALPIGRVSP
jgi:signal transduction histidine kinase